MSACRACSLASPNLNLRFQFNSQSLRDSAADQLDESQDVARGRIGVGDDEVGVPVAHFGAADTRALEPRLIDQHPGADAAGILENAAGALVAERLTRLLHDPHLLHPLREFLRV